MGSDRARVSYDAKQHYRSVVMQQGRVTLEADWNESQSILDEALREETLDIVGPSGTPDGGYRLSQTGAPPPAPFDFTVSAGTAYVGGLRLVLDAPVLYSQQGDWLDTESDPDWLPLRKVRHDIGEYVYLLLREQEISAAEDRTLLDVALGGPDTAQRSRLIQHIVRLASQADTCLGGLAAAQTDWASKGLLFDPATLRLNSQARLQASFDKAPQPVDPCEPELTGGYLGADNQLIRIQVTGPNSLVWGFDNASFLYRVSLSADGKIVTLPSQPVDAFHQPQTGQAVEALRCAARLANGEYAASVTGYVQTLAAPYNPDTLQIELPAALTPEYLDPKQTPQVFLRVWQQELGFTPGKPVELGDTGLFVTLNTVAGAPFRLGDYWQIAVRPTTATALYPRRYLDAPQAPDGPRLWACPLAAIHWSQRGGLTVDEYCLPPFDNLVDLSKRKGSGCCTVSVTPADLAGDKSLQTIIDGLAGRGPVKLCLGPGEYTLDAPLELDSRHANLSIEACPGGAILRANVDFEAKFLQGLILLSAAANIRLNGLTLVLPRASYRVGTDKNPYSAHIAIGLRPVDCENLSVEDCTFVFPPEQPSDATPLLGVGILAGGECVGWRLLRNQFAGVANADGVPAGFLTGFALYPTSDVTAPAGNFLGSWVDRVLLRDNRFEDLTIAVLAYADCGQVDLEANTVRGCANGFVFFTLPTLSYVDRMPQATIAQPQIQAGVTAHNTLFSTLANPAFQNASSVLRTYPLPTGYTPAKQIQLTPNPALQNDLAGLQSFYAQILPVAAPATPAASAPRQPLTPARFTQSVLVSIRDLLSGTSTSAVSAAAQAPAASLANLKLSSQALTLTAHPFADIQPAAVSLSTLNLNASLLEKQFFTLANVRTIPLSLRFVGNEVQALGRGALAGTAVFVYSLGSDERDSVSLTGNTLIGAGSLTYLPVAIMAGGSRCVVTGNTILNEASATTVLSLVVYTRHVTPSRGGRNGGFAAAITGNVLRGIPVLPPRELSPTPPAPMDGWEFFNSIT